MGVFKARAEALQDEKDVDSDVKKGESDAKEAEADADEAEDEVKKLMELKN